MKNLSQTLVHFDLWLNSQAWLTSSLGLIESTITSFTPDIKTARDCCTYTLIGTMVLAGLTALLGHNVSAFFSMGVIMFVCALLLMRVLDGVASMKSSSVFMSIMDVTRIYVLIAVVAEIVMALLCVFNHGDIPVFVFGTFTSIGFLMALLFGKNIMERSPPVVVVVTTV